MHLNQITKQINANAKHLGFYSILNVIEVYYVKVNNKKMLYFVLYFNILIVNLY